MVWNWNCVVVWNWTCVMVCNWTCVMVCNWTYVVMCNWTYVVMCNWTYVVMCNCQTLHRHVQCLPLSSTFWKAPSVFVFLPQCLFFLHCNAANDTITDSLVKVIKAAFHLQFKPAWGHRVSFFQLKFRLPPHQRAATDPAWSNVRTPMSAPIWGCFGSSLSF